MMNPKRLTVKQKSDLYKDVFGTPNGRRVLADINVLCKVLGRCNNDIEEGGRRIAVHLNKWSGISEGNLLAWMREIEQEILGQ